MMKYTKAKYYRSINPVSMLSSRLVDMMNDYGITLRTAIEWDMLGFMPYESKRIMLTPEEEVEYYLYMNYIPESSRIFFTAIAMGELPDYVLTEDDKMKPYNGDNTS